MIWTRALYFRPQTKAWVSGTRCKCFCFCEVSRKIYQSKTNPIRFSRGASYYTMRTCFYDQTISVMVESWWALQVITRFETVVSRIFASEYSSHNTRFLKVAWLSSASVNLRPFPPKQCWTGDLYLHLRNFCRSNAPPTKQIRDCTTFQHWVGGEGDCN